MDKLNSILSQVGDKHIYKHDYSNVDLVLSDLSSIENLFTKGDQLKIFCLSGKRIFTTSKDLAIAEYMNNSTIYFVDSIKAKSILSKCMDIRNLSEVKISVFFSKAGSRMPLHWDSLFNLTVQLSGEKIWDISANSIALFPLINYSVSDVKATNLHFGGNAPEVTCLERLKMSKGDVLYLPQGYWHMTYTVKDSVSLSINFKHRNILKIVDEAIKNSFQKHAIFRKPLDQLACLTAEDRDRVHAELDTILQREGIL